MTNWRAVIIGFILTVFVRAFFGHYEFVGLIIVGFIVGYIAHSGALGGMWNAAVAGAFGTIVSAILFIILVTVGTSVAGPLGGLTGFTISGITGLVEVVMELIYYAIVMGITGAFGGLISSRQDRR